VKRHLAPGGIVVQNIDAGTLLLDSSLATMEHEFQNVEYIRDAENVSVVAYDGAKKSDAELQQTAAAMDATYHFPYSLAAMVRGRRTANVGPGVKPLTDDFAPVDTLNAIASHNQKWK
jgi:hypothetical protein